jgi:two-component system sensor histidine kinase BaeS
VDPPPSPFGPPPGRPPGPDEENPNWFQANQSSKNLQLAQKRFFHTLSLHSADKTIVAKYRSAPKTIYWHSIESDGDIIGYISFDKPTYVLKKNEAIFLQQLFLFFTKIALVMVLVSVLTAAVISRWLLSPVSKLSGSAREVTRGDLSTRVDYRSNDEIGELCLNFNNMCAKLESNELARRQWVADISHEMRTPVAVLKAQIEAMLDGIRPRTEENIELLGNKIESLEQLINDLYELALSDTGDLKLTKTSTDIDDFFQRFVNENKHRAKEKGISMSYGSQINGPELVEFDSGKITQVLNNLLNNSLSYTDAPGEIQWELNSSEKFIILTAEDSAPGVDVEEINKIFDRLYRIEKSRNRALGGAGLGLPLSRNIATAHGGELNAECSSIGGLKLILKLPRSTS